MCHVAPRVDATPQFNEHFFSPCYTFPQGSQKVPKIGLVVFFCIILHTNRHTAPQNNLLGSSNGELMLKRLFSSLLLSKALTNRSTHTHRYTHRYTHAQQVVFRLI